MGRVVYDSKRIIPAPFINIQKNYYRSGDGHKIGSTYVLTLVGKLVSDRGSPATSGFNGGDDWEDKFWTLGGFPPNQADNGLDSLLIKQEALRNLFSRDGLSLEVQCGGDTPPLKCYPRINSLNFPEDIWADTMDYSIELEAPEVFGLFESEDASNNQDYFKDVAGNKLYITQADENWSLETQEQPENIGLEFTYRLTHGINAVGQQAYDGDGFISAGWEQARRWAFPKMGLDTNFLHSTSGLSLPAYYQALNHVVTENTDELGGGYSISETWIISSGNVIEDCNISKNESLETSLVNVAIDGSIQGLNSTSQSKFEAALSKWNTLVAGGPTHDIYNRAKSYAGINLNSQPLQNTYATNPIAGNINYTFQYDDRPSNYIANAKSEIITISDTKPADVVGRVTVPGRAAGPVLQDMSTITEYHRTLTIDVVMPHYSGVAPTNASNVATMLASAPTSQIQVIVDAFDDNLRASYNQVFVESDQVPTWSPKTGQYSRSVTWLYQDCILSVDTPPISGNI